VKSASPLRIDPSPPGEFACRGGLKTPEDHTNFNKTAVETSSDSVMFAMFMTSTIQTR